jgi:hypothetical protein
LLRALRAHARWYCVWINPLMGVFEAGKLNTQRGRKEAYYGCIPRLETYRKPGPQRRFRDRFASFASPSVSKDRRFPAWKQFRKNTLR